MQSYHIYLIRHGMTASNLEKRICPFARKGLPDWRP